MAMSTRYFGCHVSASGGIENALRAGKSLGVNTIQLHPSPPQRWNGKPFAKGVESTLLNELPQSGIEKIFFHAIYLINLASGNPDNVENAILSLCNYLELSARIGGAGVIVHVGSMKDQPDEERGYDQVAVAIKQILDRTPPTSRLLLEVSAGSGAIIGARLEELRTIRDRVGASDRLLYALDTQHMWASGYDWQNSLPEILENLGTTFGFDNIGAIHLNDSKTALASRTDRHENLGLGLIGESALTAFVRAPQIRDIPLILETPRMKDIASAGEDVAKLKEMIG